MSPDNIQINPNKIFFSYVTSESDVPPSTLVKKIGYLHRINKVYVSFDQTLRRKIHFDRFLKKSMARKILFEGGMKGRKHWNDEWAGPILAENNKNR